jgi:hypothetical protein
MHYPSPSISFTAAGAHRDSRTISFSIVVNLFYRNTIFNRKNKPKMENGSNGNEKLQIIYRWKALTKENSLK